MNTDFVIDAAHWQAPLPRRRHDVLQRHLTCTEKFRDRGVVSVKQWRFEHLFTKQKYSTYVNTPVLHKLNQSVLHYSRSMYNRLLSTGNGMLFRRHQWCSAVLYACNDVQIRCSCWHWKDLCMCKVWLDNQSSSLWVKSNTVATYFRSVVVVIRSGYCTPGVFEPSSLNQMMAAHLCWQFACSDLTKEKLKDVLLYHHSVITKSSCQLCCQHSGMVAVCQWRSAWQYSQRYQN